MPRWVKLDKYLVPLVPLVVDKLAGQHQRSRRKQFLWYKSLDYEANGAQLRLPAFCTPRQSRCWWHVQQQLPLISCSDLYCCLHNNFWWYPTREDLFIWTIIHKESCVFVAVLKVQNSIFSIKKFLITVHQISLLYSKSSVKVFNYEIMRTFSSFFPFIATDRNGKNH